jgi:PAS domain-containing protein
MSVAAGVRVTQLASGVKPVGRVNNTADHVACVNDRVPQTPPLWEFADASTLFSAVAAVADALYVVGPEGRIRFLSPTGLTILQYQDERQLLGRPSHDTIHYLQKMTARASQHRCGHQ